MVQKRLEERGKLLTVLIVIETLLLLVSILTSGNVIRHPFSLSGYSLLLNLLTALCMVGVWMWRKIAVYSLIVLLAISIIASFIVGLPPEVAKTHINLLNPNDEIVHAVWSIALSFLVYFTLWVYAIKR